jgi:hypothetical protein
MRQRQIDLSTLGRAIAGRLSGGSQHFNDQDDRPLGEALGVFSIAEKPRFNALRSPQQPSRHRG